MSASKLGVSALLRLKGAENGTDELYSRADYRTAVGGRGSVVRRREDGVDMPRFPGPGQRGEGQKAIWRRSEEHTSELQSLMRISYAVFCLKNKLLLILFYI